MSNITAERVRGLLHYEPETGNWAWLKSAPGRRRGLVAGSVSQTNGYRYIRIDYTHHPAHGLAWLYMTGIWPVADIDHINGDRADNRWCNLREATRSQNNANARARATNTSGFKGVTWKKSHCKWLAQISVNGKHKHLGHFERAFIAYCFAAWKYHGEFANIDAGYIRAIRKRRMLETAVLWNLARPDYMIAA